MATNVVASQTPNGDRLQRRPLVPKIKKNCKNSNPLTSLQVDCLTATDCNANRSCQFHMYTNAKVLKFEALSSIIDAVMTSLFLKKDTFWLTHVVLISMTFFYSPFHRQCLSFVAHPHPPEQQSSSSLRCHVSNNTTNTSRYFCNYCTNVFTARAISKT